LKGADALIGVLTRRSGSEFGCEEESVGDCIGVVRGQALHHLGAEFVAGLFGGRCWSGGRSEGGCRRCLLKVLWRARAQFLVLTTQTLRLIFSRRLIRNEIVDRERRGRLTRRSYFGGSDGRVGVERLETIVRGILKRRHKGPVESFLGRGYSKLMSKSGG
jgi:hypothetical protein